MYECGRIIKVSGKKCTVACGTEKACQACKSPLCSKRDRLFDVRNQQGFDLKPGDNVEFLLPSGRTIFESFLVLILPLFMFIIFYYLGMGIFDLTTDGPKILCGVAGIGFGFLIALIYTKIRKDKDIPVITKKIED